MGRGTIGRSACLAASDSAMEAEVSGAKWAGAGVEIEVEATGVLPKEDAVEPVAGIATPPTTLFWGVRGGAGSSVSPSLSALPPLLLTTALLPSEKAENPSLLSLSDASSQGLSPEARPSGTKSKSRSVKEDDIASGAPSTAPAPAPVLSASSSSWDSELKCWGGVAKVEAVQLRGAS